MAAAGMSRKLEDPAPSLSLVGSTFRSMARRKIERTIPRVTLTRPEAAAALGMSIDHFDRHVRPTLRVVQTGALNLWPVKELEKWAEREAQMELGRPAPRKGDR
jgi:hypothetical protein